MPGVALMLDVGLSLLHLSLAKYIIYDKQDQKELRRSMNANPTQIIIPVLAP
jgi:hypothetical protein